MIVGCIKCGKAIHIDEDRSVESTTSISCKHCGYLVHYNSQSFPNVSAEKAPIISVRQKYESQMPKAKPPELPVEEQRHQAMKQPYRNNDLTDSLQQWSQSNIPTPRPGSISREHIPSQNSQKAAPQHRSSSKPEIPRHGKQSQTNDRYTGNDVKQTSNNNLESRELDHNLLPKTRTQGYINPNESLPSYALPEDSIPEHLLHLSINPTYSSSSSNHSGIHSKPRPPSPPPSAQVDDLVAPNYQSKAKRHNGIKPPPFIPPVNPSARFDLDDLSTTNTDNKLDEKTDGMHFDDNTDSFSADHSESPTRTGVSALSSDDLQQVLSSEGALGNKHETTLRLKRERAFYDEFKHQRADSPAPAPITEPVNHRHNKHRPENNMIVTAPGAPQLDIDLSSNSVVTAREISILPTQSSDSHPSLPTHAKHSNKPSFNLEHSYDNLTPVPSQTNELNKSLNDSIDPTESNVLPRFEIPSRKQLPEDSGVKIPVQSDTTALQEQLRSSYNSIHDHYPNASSLPPEPSAAASSPQLEAHLATLTTTSNGPSVSSLSAASALIHPDQLKFSQNTGAHFTHTPSSFTQHLRTQVTGQAIKKDKTGHNWQTYLGMIFGALLGFVTLIFVPQISAFKTLQIQIINTLNENGLLPNFGSINGTELSAIEAQNTEIVPFRTKNGHLMIVRGVAVNHGQKEINDINVLIHISLNNTIISVKRAHLGWTPDRYQLEQIHRDPPVIENISSLQPGERLPFTLVMPLRVDQMQNFRFRVTFAKKSAIDLE